MNYGVRKQFGIYPACFSAMCPDIKNYGRWNIGQEAALLFKCIEIVRV